MPLFLMTAAFIIFFGAENEACKKDGLEPKECVERVVDESQPVDYSKFNG